MSLPAQEPGASGALLHETGTFANESEPAARRRMVVHAVSGALACWAFAALAHALAGRMLCAAATSVAIVGLALAAAIGLLPREATPGPARIAAIAHLTVATALISIVLIAAMTGGISSPITPMLATVPLAIVLVQGLGAGIAWLAISAIATVALSSLPPAIAATYPISASEYAALAPWHLVLVFVVGLIVHRALRKANAAAERRALRAGRLAAERDGALRRAEDLARGKSAFFATVSHELRTPLGGVLGLTTALESTHLDASQREIVAAMRASGDSLRAIVNDVLDLEQLERGQLRFEEGVVEVDTLITSVADLFGPASLAKGVEVIAHVDATVPLRVSGDPHRVRQVLTNLVANAVKFTDVGQVRIHATWASDTEARPIATPARSAPRHGIARPGSLRVLVTDSGPGIEPARLDRLFSPFAQGDATVARRFGGSGLGLAISKQLSDAMSGTLRARSELGRGSQFAFELPTTSVPSDERMTLAGLPRVTLVSPVSELRAAWADAATRRAVAADSVAHVWELEALAGQLDVVVIDLPAGQAPEEALIELRSIPSMRMIPCVLAVGPALLGVARAVADRCPSGCAVTMKPLSFARALAAAVDVIAESDGLRRSSSRPAPSSMLRVLVADDDRINRMATRLLLKKSGLAIDEAADGRGALDAYRAGHHEVLILDVHMPDMLGTEVAREIRRRPLPPGAPAPFIIALTAGAFAADREACLSAGMDTFLTKPLDPAALHAALESAERRTRRERRMATPMLELSEGDFDWARLDSLWSLCDSDAERYELVSAYLRQSEELTEELKASTTAGQWGVAADAAHKVAGATSTVGALGVERAARSFERLVRASEPPGRPPDARDDISHALENLLGALTSAERALHAKAMRVRARPT